MHRFAKSASERMSGFNSHTLRLRPPIRRTSADTVRQLLGRGRIVAECTCFENKNRRKVIASSNLALSARFARGSVEIRGMRLKEKIMHGESRPLRLRPP